MGVKGINKKSHFNLIEALDKLNEAQLESGLPSDVQQISFFKEELNQFLESYESILKQLVNQVEAYDHLAVQIKLQFINRRLRSLKNLVPKESESFEKIKSCIYLINSYN